MATSMDTVASSASTATIAPTIPLLPPASEIPSAFTASFRQWWGTGDKQSGISEQRLLHRALPFYTANLTDDPPPGPVRAYSSKVTLPAPPKHSYLNMLSIVPTAASKSNAAGSPPAAVLLHGYGAGLGFYFQNLPTLSDWAVRRNTPVYALDWLGMGRSARVPFNIKANRNDITARVSAAESFFVDSLEQWRQQMQLDKMTLIGHSLGAYFSVVYALKYPTRVNKLILISPAGVPRDPDTTIPSKELDETASAGSAGSVEPATKGKVKEIEEEQKQAKKSESRTRKLFTYLWEEGWSPFQVVRTAMFWGPWLVGKYSARRFSGLTPEETKDMHDYILNITLAKGSGEYCISHLLAPGAHARMPLVDRIDALKIPVTFVYGDHDWMDPEGGSESVERLRKAGNGKGRMYIVNNAGHHVYLDNPKHLNALLVKELDRD